MKKTNMESSKRTDIINVTCEDNRRQNLDSYVNTHDNVNGSTPLCISSGISTDRRTPLSSTASISTVHRNIIESNEISKMRVPIIGYEVMEERARFTVYKLRVENPYNDECWMVLRRYTDFLRLNSKLKQTFPQTTLALPRKNFFGDNFNAEFLDNRVQGLQMFINSIICNEEMRKLKMVREFFCLDEPPIYSESVEECRAIYEAQEETIAHLKMQINSKNDLILKLQQKLNEVITEMSIIKESLK